MALIGVSEVRGSSWVSSPQTGDLLWIFQNLLFWTHYTGRNGPIQSDSQVISNTALGSSVPRENLPGY